MLKFVVLSLLVSLCGFGQSPETFDVAAIKLGDPLSNGTSFRFEPGASLQVEGASLKSLIQFAYDLREFQLAGATGWITTERYNIRAKGEIVEGPPDYRQMNDAQRKTMSALIRKRLQALLAERFQLTVHKETKEFPMYGLVVAKNGVKMQPNTSPDGSPQSMSMGRSAFRATRASADAIAQSLAGMVGRPVKDETGLTGFFDFKMEWTPDANPNPGTNNEERPDNLGPTLFTALQEQLGLRLVSRKGPVEILVIDRAERASEN